MQGELLYNKMLLELQNLLQNLFESRKTAMESLDLSVVHGIRKKTNLEIVFPEAAAIKSHVQKS